jgi:hypothetical protein
VAFAGSGVEFSGNVVEDAGTVEGQISALGEVLALQSVGRSYVCQVVVGSMAARAADSMTR